MQKTFLLLPTLLFTSAVGAQELTLFEPIESGPAQEQVAQPQQGFINQNGQPAYTVRSTSHIGDVYSATLIDRQGKQTEVKWRKGERSPLAEVPAFIVEDIQLRSVVLTQPGNDPCVAAPAQGVSCLDGNRALLSLALAAPLPPTAQTLPAQQIPGANGAVDASVPQNPFEAAIQAQQQAAAQAAAQGLPVPVPGAPQGFFVNPFNGQAEVIDQQSPQQQAARDARQRARAERLNRFEPARIPDDQIPAGMRRVTTPFGDRLIPERE